MSPHWQPCRCWTAVWPCRHRSSQPGSSRCSPKTLKDIIDIIVFLSFKKGGGVYSRCLLCFPLTLLPSLFTLVRMMNELPFDLVKASTLCPADRCVMSYPRFKLRTPSAIALSTYVPSFSRKPRWLSSPHDNMPLLFLSQHWQLTFTTHKRNLSEMENET